MCVCVCTYVCGFPSVASVPICSGQWLCVPEVHQVVRAVFCLGQSVCLFLPHSWPQNSSSDKGGMRQSVRSDQSSKSVFA